MLLEVSTEKLIWGHFTGHTEGERKGTTSFSGVVQIDQAAIGTSLSAHNVMFANSRRQSLGSLSSPRIYRPCCGGMPILRGFFVNKGLLHIEGRPRTHD